MKRFSSAVSVLLSICVFCSAIVLVSAGMLTGVTKDGYIGDHTSAVILPSVSNVEVGSSVSEKNGEADTAPTVFTKNDKLPIVPDNSVPSDIQKDNDTVLTNSEAKKAPVFNSALPVNTAFSSVYESVTDAVFDYEYTDSIYSVNHAEAYRLIPDGRGTVTVKLSHDSLSAGAFKASLYVRYSPNGDGKDYSWRLLNELETTARGGTYKSAPIGVMPGKYKVVVSCLNNNVPDKAFTIEFLFSDSTDFEVEYNDTFTRYNEIIPGRAVRGSASYFSDGKDYDWYMFRVYNDGAVTFTFDHPTKDLPTVCWKITVYDSDMNEIYSDNSYFSTASRRLGKIGVQKGCYYICVENRVYFDAVYTLTVRRYSDLPYESEYNDTKEKANIINMGVPITGELSSRSSGSDVDWFKFTLADDGYCVFDFEHEADKTEIENVQNGHAPKNGWRFTVMTQNGASVYGTISTWDMSKTTSPQIGLGAGEYYIKVDSEDLYHNTAPYTIGVVFEKSKLWEKETNNTFRTANELAAFVPVNATLSSFEADFDTDWFVFEISKKGMVTVELGHEPGFDGSNIFSFSLYDSSLGRISLTDEKGNALLGSGNTPVYSVSSFRNQKSSYAYCTLAPGKYYVKVVPGLYYDSMPYTITYTFTEVE